MEKLSEHPGCADCGDDMIPAENGCWECLNCGARSDGGLMDHLYDLIDRMMTKGMLVKEEPPEAWEDER